MSWRVTAAVVGCFVLGGTVACGGGAMRVKKGEPQTAREKMLAEQKAEAKANKNADSGDGEEADEPRPPGSKKWTGWRYQGDRTDCFFLVGKKCFKSEKAACAAARCKTAEACQSDGAGPATVTCSTAKD